jgi:site-specific recombinase XerD
MNAQTNQPTIQPTNHPTIQLSNQPIIHLSTQLTALITTPDTALWTSWNNAYHGWLQAKRRLSDAGNTVRTYQTAYRQFYQWANTAPWDITPDHAAAWADYLSAHGRANGRGGLKPSTINLKLAALASFYDHILKHTDLWPADRRNPFHTVERTKITPYGHAAYPTHSQARQLLQTCNRRYLTGRRDYALILAYLTTGHRASEILNLTWGQLQADRPRIRAKGNKTIRSAFGLQTRQAILDYIKADGRLSCIREDDYIFIPIDPTRAQRLRTEKPLPGAYVVYHLADPTHTRDFDTYAEAALYHDLLLDYEQPTLLKRNRPLTNAQVNRSLKKYAARAGIDPKKAHLHGLRHAFGRHMADTMRTATGAVDYELLQKQLGHTGIATTQIYAETILDGGNPYLANIEADLISK